MTKTILRLPESGHLTERERERSKKVGEELSFDSTAGAGRNLLLTENTFVPEVGGFIAPQAGLNERFHLPS